VPSFRVTYRVVVEAVTDEEAIAEAAKVVESGALTQPGGRTDVTVERIPDPGSPSGFIAEGVRRKHRTTGN
jgi:hypothetical protein